MLRERPAIHGSRLVHHADFLDMLGDEHYRVRRWESVLLAGYNPIDECDSGTYDELDLAWKRVWEDSEDFDAEI